MQQYEYKVVPAPTQGEKARGAKSTEGRFALALANAINAEARQGWDYLQSETLPTEERAGLTGRRTVYVNLLVFRRALAEGADRPLDPPAAATPKPLLGLRAFAPRRADAAPAPAPRIDPVADSTAPRLGPATGAEDDRNN